MSDTEDVALRIPKLALGIPNLWNAILYLAREIGLPWVRCWAMASLRAFGDEPIQCGWAQRSATALQQWA
ncbi:hypothetical protein MK280_18620 [Myxococcota bacterium]|nr:hypothetical protein [Myxococcota bacterium]